MQTREVLIWVILIIAVAAAILLFKGFFSSPELFVTLGFANATQSAYTYQNVHLPILVSNAGKGIAGSMSVGVFINRSLVSVYNVTLPPNMSVDIPFNYTFASAGNYTVQAEIDPGHLYDIADRNRSSAELSLDIKNPEPAIYGSMLPALNASHSSYYTESNLGYILSSYLSQRYGLRPFEFSSIPESRAFFYPLLNYTIKYIVNVSVSEAAYNNSAYDAIWISGYLSPSVIEYAASSLHLNTSSFAENGINVTMVQLSGNTTLCSWYDSGWIKNLVYKGSKSCANGMVPGDALEGKGINIPNMTNSTVLRNDLSMYNGSFRRGRLFATGGHSFIYGAISGHATNQSTLCTGVISVFDSVSYCSEYLLPLSGAIGNTSLIRTSALVDGYNLSVFSLTNTSEILSQVQKNVEFIHSFNISGTALNFSSSLVNSCSFNNGVICSNASFENSTLYFELKNPLGKNISITSLGCVWKGQFMPIAANTVVDSRGSADLSTKCYSYGLPFNGIPLNLNLDLFLNYTEGNETLTAAGIARIV